MMMINKSDRQKVVEMSCCEACSYIWKISNPCCNVPLQFVVRDEFCNSILDALSSASILKKDSKNEVMNNGFVERVVKHRSNRFDMLTKQSNWTASLINDFKDSYKKSNVTSILHDYNRKIDRKFSTLIPNELIPFLSAFCSEVNRNPCNVKRTLNILQVIFEVVKVKNIDEDDVAVAAKDDAWPELSKKLVVWILLCAAYPHRISVIAQVVLDFDQQRRSFIRLCWSKSSTT